MNTIYIYVTLYVVIYLRDYYWSHDIQHVLCLVLNIPSNSDIIIIMIPQYGTNIRTVYVRQKECNKHAVVALISVAYRAPHLSLCVRRTLTLSLKVRRLVKLRNPRIAALFQGLWRFSRENVVRFTELRRVGKNRGSFGIKRRDTLPAQIQRQTIKVWHVSYQKVVHQV